MPAYPFRPSRTWREFLDHLKDDHGIQITEVGNQLYDLSNPVKGRIYVVSVGGMEEMVAPSQERSTVTNLGFDPIDFGYDLQEWWTSEVYPEDDE